MQITKIGARRRNPLLKLLAIMAALTLSLPALADDDFRLTEVKWESGDAQLVVKGKDARRRATVTITNANTGALVAQFTAQRSGEFERKLSGVSPTPCRIRAVTGSESDEKNVRNAPSNCDGGDARDDDDDRDGDDGDSGDGGSGNGGSGGEIPEHMNLSYTGPGTCLQCHSDQAHDILGSTHYQWKGLAPDMLNDTGALQGKHAGAVNTYCGNITGNWDGCSSCHIGLGAEPTSDSNQSELENIDCLICHQEQYKRKAVPGPTPDSIRRIPDADNMAITLDEAVRTVHQPTRVTCLQCHATAGGGDAVKRGDLALATGNTSDKNYDVHMATTGANLSCQECHMPQGHRFPGKGSDLRPTDLDVVLDCADCHQSTPHDSRDLNRHTAKVACQTCHIPVYAKNASDSAADEATEVERSWRDGTHHTTTPYHPVLTKANDLTPIYRHWNRKSDNYLLGDNAGFIYNPATDTYQTSIPDGAVGDAASKLYPFKYKTSDYPLHIADNTLIALDTRVFFATADADAAALSGMANMGYSDPQLGDFTWVTTDTYQLLNHQVSDEDDALSCNSCHLNTARMDLQGSLGYAPANTNPATCSQGCHGADDASEWSMGNFNDFREGHSEHRGEGVGCAECHAFSRN